MYLHHYDHTHIDPLEVCTGMRVVRHTSDCTSMEPCPYPAKHIAHSSMQSKLTNKCEYTLHMFVVLRLPLLPLNTLEMG